MGVVEPVTVRPARLDDLHAMAAFDEHLSGNPDRWTMLHETIADPRGTCLVAEDSASMSVTGYVVVAPRGFFGRDFIEVLHVAKPWRRRGIGIQLMRAAVGEAGAQTVFTSTNESNHAMRELLRQDGWIVSGTLDGLDEGDPEVVYYLPGGDPS
jgi:ribosomal protein S18 acetylase RimI-like enzyme